MTHLLWSMSSLSPCTGTNFLKAEKVFVYLVTVAIIQVAELHRSLVTLSWLHKARRPKILIFSLPHASVALMGIEVPTFSSSSGMFEVF